MPRMLHHSGFVTHDAAKTVDFYSRGLGMESVSTVMDDRVPSTAEVDECARRLRDNGADELPGSYKN